MSGNFVKWINTKRMRATLIMAALLALMGVFLVIPGTHAQGVLGWAANIAEGALITVVTTLIYGIVWFFGMLVTVTLIPILVMVASYNDFATEYGVQLGWTVGGGGGSGGGGWGGVSFRFFFFFCFCGGPPTSI